MDTAESANTGRPSKTTFSQGRFVGGWLFEEGFWAAS